MTAPATLCIRCNRVYADHIHGRVALKNTWGRWAANVVSGLCPTGALEFFLSRADQELHELDAQEAASTPAKSVQEERSRIARALKETRQSVRQMLLKKNDKVCDARIALPSPTAKKPYSSQVRNGLKLAGRP